MGRLDPRYAALQRDVAAQGGETADSHRVLKQRESELASVYHQLAVKFADLHDTSGQKVNHGHRRVEGVSSLLSSAPHDSADRIEPLINISYRYSSKLKFEIEIRSMQHDARLFESAH